MNTLDMEELRHRVLILRRTASTEGTSYDKKSSTPTTETIRFRLSRDTVHIQCLHPNLLGDGKSKRVPLYFGLGYNDNSSIQTDK